MVMAPSMKVYNASLPLPALQRLDRCLNALSSKLYRSVVASPVRFTLPISKFNTGHDV